MEIRFGDSNQKFKIIFGDSFATLNVGSNPITVSNLLQSSDNYILKDCDGIYLIAKEAT